MINDHTSMKNTWLDLFGVGGISLRDDPPSTHPVGSPSDTI